MIDDIVKEAGHWADPLHQGLSYLANHQTKEGIMYRLRDIEVRATLEHFRLYKSREVFEFYQHVYEGIVCDNKKEQPTREPELPCTD